MSTAIILLLIAVFVSSMYWLVLFFKLASYKDPRSYAKKGELSMVIAAKNEAQNLKKYVPMWLKQSPKPREFIIIDDFSSDNTAKVIESFTAQGVKHLSATHDIKGKKAALTQAINASKGTTLLFTDADCKPISDQWSHIMSSYIDDKKLIALGYGPMIKTSGFLNKFIRFETIMVAIQYFGYTLMGQPYMAVGRNLAFAKKIFLENKGYENHLDVASGDDDLFIRDAATKNNTAIVLDPDSFVFSLAPDTLKKYLRQKNRHLSTAKHYKFKIQFLLSIHPVFFLIACLLSFYLILKGQFLVVAATWVTRWVLLMITGLKVFSRLRGKDLLFYLPLLDLCWLPHYLYFTLPSFKKSSNHWN